MNKSEFLVGLQKQLELDHELELTTNLKELETWDSIADMVLISYVDRVAGMKINSHELVKITTVESLLEFINLK